MGEAPESIQHAGDASGHVEIAAEGVRKGFAGRAVLRGVDLSIRAGEIVAVVGGSGCGKTVLLNLITGLLPVDSGRVLVADYAAPRGSRGDLPLVDIATLGDEELDRVRLRWAVVFQKNALFSGTVEENINLWLREHTAMAAAKIRQRVRESLAAVALDVDDVLGKQREQLSGGMAKRVAIARAIAVDPGVIFYDEPTTGLDPVVSGHVHELIWSTHHRPREDGTRRTTVIVTHDKDLLRRLRPRVVMLDHGLVAFDGPYEAFTASTVEAARQYLAAMPVLQMRGAE